MTRLKQIQRIQKLTTSETQPIKVQNVNNL